MDIEFDDFVQNPRCLWDLKTTKRLVELKWSALISVDRFIKPSEYSTASILSNNAILEIDKLSMGLNPRLETYLENYSENYIGKFYLENGLSPLPKDELISAKEKLKSALAIFDYSGGPLQTINLLIRSIHVVKQDDHEIDISHSDPKIPFSIFVSVCKDISPISNLRVAESILHEAMHLQLTLFETIVPLVKSDSNETYYSPWRDGERPVQGVLHGLFVFRAIFDLLNAVQANTGLSEIRHYLNNRKDRILSEFKHLKNFSASEGLTRSGANLAKNLLPSN